MAQFFDLGDEGSSAGNTRMADFLRASQQQGQINEGLKSAGGLLQYIPGQAAAGAALSSAGRMGVGAKIAGAAKMMKW